MKRPRILIGCLVAIGSLFMPLPVDATPATFREVVGFATKTGFRGIVAWQADKPVAGFVEYSVNNGPTLTALPLANLVDTAQIAIIDGLPEGATVSFSVRDRISDTASAAESFVARNAYTNEGVPYTLNALVQLDSPAAPDGVLGLGLGDMARGVNIFAERLYDALDGNARIGTVLVTDTLLDYPVNVPFGPHALVGLRSRPDAIRKLGCALNGNVGGVGAGGHTLSDLVIETTVPLDSHTFTPWMIDDPCTAFYFGRLGQLIIRWEDDLHLGYVMTHEFMHYAFNAPDLYPLNSTADCYNLDWDGSLMHNGLGWNAANSRWELTEVDRNETLTPCDHGTEPYTWANLRERYTDVPLPVDPQHVFDTACRGNEDGEVLEIWILKQTPLGSTLSRFDDDAADSEPCP